MRKTLLITLALLSACFALAVTVEPRLAYTRTYERHERSPIEVILGEARRLFAGHFFTKADVYFHSGYYPGIFDRAATNHESHLVAELNSNGGEEHHEGDFLGQPLDCIDAFSRAFFPSTHTHLDEGAPCDHDHDHGAHDDEPSSGKVREMLPWLRMAAELDPSRIETYTVGAYWLRTRMNNPKQAEEFLRDGLRQNRGNSAILFELGRIYRENYRQPAQAGNLWEAALRRWKQLEASKPEPDTFLLLQITSHLASLAEEEGEPDKAIEYLQLAKTASPNPDFVQKRIDEINATLRAQ